MPCLVYADDGFRPGSISPRWIADMVWSPSMRLFPLRAATIAPRADTAPTGSGSRAATLDEARSLEHLMFCHQLRDDE